MKDLAHQIRQTVVEHAALIRALRQNDFDQKPSPAKWSKKEILGHLVDSAQNNLQRLVRAQYLDKPNIAYHQDDWVRLQGYQQYEREELLQLWLALNQHFSHILSVMVPGNEERQCDTGKGTVELHSLKFIAEDYLAHMMHHLAQITGKK